MTACLRDPSPEVRKQTLVLLIHLLQEDYLKIRGTFFFRILQLACDNDEILKDLALFYVTQRLLHRQPTIIQQHFIECVFHFNEYKGHPTYNKFSLTERERQLFSIAGNFQTSFKTHRLSFSFKFSPFFPIPTSGPAHAAQRFQIYRFMLQNLDDEARFQLTFRLSRDVLQGVVDNVMSLKNASTEAVLRDVLSVLASDDIKLASLAKETDDDPVEKEDIAQAIVQTTKKAIIAQVVKRNVIENVVPIVVALKRKLATLKSPIMGKLMSFLRELMKDYKNEIEEILAEDRQLMAEIDFDLKRFEQQERQEAGRQSMQPNRTNNIPPPDLVNSRQEDAAVAPRQQTNRKSRGGPAVAVAPPPPPAEDATPTDDAMEVDDDRPADEDQMEENEPADDAPVDPPVPVIEDEEMEPVGPPAQAATPPPPPLEPPAPAAQAEAVQARPRKPQNRVVSTPRTTGPLDVTFQMPDGDISAIPYPDQEMPLQTPPPRRTPRKRR